MTRYVGARLGKHFNESQANALFGNPKRIISPALLPLAKVVVLHDDGNLSVFKSDYFMCIRFSYLNICYDDTFIIELYFPNRFSRQFGSCQHIPRDFIRRTGFQPWKIYFNFGIVLLNSTLILSASFYCPQTLNFLGD
jgi:hypothetical protein